MTEFAEETRDDPVLYIHGYYIDFSKGCRRATVFKENAGLDSKFLWFSWPSDGSLVNNARDEVTKLLMELDLHMPSSHLPSA